MASKKKLRRTAGRPAAVESESHRDAILEIATRVFLERGFSGTSMAEIAERAGASKGTLYALYPNKTELFIGLFRRRLAKKITPSDRQAMIALDCPVEEALERIGMKLLGWVGSDEGRRWVRLVIMESERFPELVKLFWENGPAVGTKGLIQYFRSASEAGLLRIDDPQLAANHFMGMALGMPYVRNSLGMPTLIAGDAATKVWLQSVIAVFLLGYTGVLTHPPPSR